MRLKLTLLTLLLIATGIAWLIAGKTGGLTAAAPPRMGRLVVEVAPPGANVTVGGLKIDGQSPADLAAGVYDLAVRAPGYTALTQTIEIVPGYTTRVRGSLVDLTRPNVDLALSPVIAQNGEVVTARLWVRDTGSGLAAYRLSLDGVRFFERRLEGAKTHTYALPLAGLTAGLHEVTLETVDLSGNRAGTTAYVEVKLPRRAAYNIELPSPGEVVRPTPSPILTPIAPVASPAVVTVSSRVIPTYDYEPGLTVEGDFPYPRLQSEKVGPPQPREYRVVYLENDALRLAFLPESGGRLYQVTGKAAGRNLFYNNPVIKPTPWGPEEMNWWLAVGGVEWAFPVEEHGYAWASEWLYETETLTNGAAAIHLWFKDAATGLQADVSVRLPSTGRTFTLTLALTNVGDAPAAGQLWWNAAFAAGPGQAVDFPAETVKIHSLGSGEFEPGQVALWSPEFAAWGRWQSWFSAFAAPGESDSLTVCGADGAATCLRRQSPGAAAPGLKFFTWGTAAPLEEFGGTRPYFEVWGGLSADFATPVILQPGERRGWTETWTILQREETNG